MCVRKALLVIPTYEIPEDDRKGIREELAAIGLLPKPFRKYNQQNEIKTVEEILSYGTGSPTIRILTGDATKDKFKEDFKWLIEDATVAILIFCGHGENEFS